MTSAWQRRLLAVALVLTGATSLVLIWCPVEDVIGMGPTLVLVAWFAFLTGTLARLLTR